MSIHCCRISGEIGLLCDTHLYEMSRKIDKEYFGTFPHDEGTRIYTISASIEGDVCEVCDFESKEKK